MANKGNTIVNVRQHKYDRYVEGQEHGVWVYTLVALLANGDKVMLVRDKVRNASEKDRLTEPAARRTCVGKDADLFR